MRALHAWSAACLYRLHGGTHQGIISKQKLVCHGHCQSLLWFRILKKAHEIFKSCVTLRKRMAFVLVRASPMPDKEMLPTTRYDSQVRKQGRAS